MLHHVDLFIYYEMAQCKALVVDIYESIDKCLISKIKVKFVGFILSANQRQVFWSRDLISIFSCNWVSVTQLQNELFWCKKALLVPGHLNGVM